MPSSPVAFTGVAREAEWIDARVNVRCFSLLLGLCVVVFWIVGRAQ